MRWCIALAACGTVATRPPAAVAPASVLAFRLGAHCDAKRVIARIGPSASIVRDELHVQVPPARTTAAVRAELRTAPSVDVAFVEHVDPIAVDADALEAAHGTLEFMRDDASVVSTDLPWTEAMAQPHASWTVFASDRASIERAAAAIRVPDGLRLAIGPVAPTLWATYVLGPHAHAPLARVIAVVEDGTPAIDFELTPAASLWFRELSTQRGGGAVAFVVDGVVVTAVHTVPIEDGRMTLPFSTADQRDELFHVLDDALVPCELHELG